MLSEILFDFMFNITKGSMYYMLNKTDDSIEKIIYEAKLQPIQIQIKTEKFQKDI
jgi:hypothetical protein